MLFIRILNFIKGYLVITASGRFTERFINICIRRNMTIWDMKSDRGIITAKLATSDFFDIRDVARITSTRVRIKRRVGLGFLCKRYRSRWPLVFAVLLFVGIMYYTSTHVMSIEITGNQRIPTEQIADELSRVGLSIGVRASDIVSDEIRNKIMIMDEDVSWLGVNVRGSRVYIEVAERIDSESIPHETEEPCNVVALKDGVIDEMQVKQGQTMVKKGDGVREGDLLVSGIMDSMYGGFRTVHAYGEIWAKTQYSKEADYPLVYSEREYSDNVKTFFGIDVLGKCVDLFPRNNIDYSRFEERSTDYVFKTNILGRDIEVGGKRYDFVGYNTVQKQRTVSEAVELGERELTEQVEAEVPKEAKVLSKTTDHNIISGETVRVTVTWYCSENIAREVTIEETDEFGETDKIEKAGEVAE